MKKLIVIDGVDGIGKTTQAKIIAERLNAKLFIQPNDSNCVGFLREEVKNNPRHEPFTRQLLHTVSHTVDAFTQFNQHNCYVMDRCHSSTYAYGLAQDMKLVDIELLMKIHANVYAEALSAYDIRIILLDRTSKFKVVEDDEFEKMVNWGRVRANFQELWGTLENSREYLFSPTEKRLYLNIDNMEKDAISTKMLEFVS